MTNYTIHCLLFWTLIVLPLAVDAAGPGQVAIEGQSYSLTEELAKSGASETFASVDRFDVSPSGRYAVAVRSDLEDPGQGDI